MPALQLHEPELVGAPLSHHAANALREAIEQGELRPGERLVEATIASQLNLSRGPVRDALKQLEREGLVTITPRRGTFVSRLDESDVWEIATLRAIVESFAAGLLAQQGDGATVDQLEATLAEMAAVGDESPVRFATLDLRFHETLVRAAGHKRLLLCWANLRTQIWMFIRETRLGQLRPAGSTIEIHQAIVTAIRNRDRAEAERWAKFHSEHTIEALITHLKN